MPPVPAGGPRFVTPEANGYARFMRSIRSPLVEFCAAVLLVALGAVSASSHASATLYKWVDADGITHYSDRPAPGAEKVQIAGAQSYRGASTAATPSRRAANAPAAAPRYSRLEITRPSEGESFVNNGGSVDAAAVVEPGLANGHQLWFVLDGTRQPDPAGGAMTMTFQVDRGTHTMAAVITDETGRELMSSAGITFYVRQNSILANPPRGPAITPPKKKG